MIANDDPVLKRKKRLARRFKLAIVVATAVVMAGIGIGTESGRYALTRGWFGAKKTFRNAIGWSLGREWEVDIEEMEALRATETEHTLRGSEASFQRVFDQSSPAMQHLFEVAGMSPQPGANQVLIRPGNINWGLILSSSVYEPHPSLSFRFRPNTRSIFLRNVILAEGLTAIAHLPDSPEVLDAVERLNLTVNIARNERGDIAVQTTNSLGLRGPEPDPSAEIQVLVIGDSYMQGFLIDDEDTPARCLERYLEETLETSVSVCNASNQGWGPKEYAAAMQEFCGKDVDLVIVSVCPNDFGDGFLVINGRGDDWVRAEYYLRQIQRKCFVTNLPLICCPVPGEKQLRSRLDGHYPARVATMMHMPSENYCYPIEAFTDVELRWRRDHVATTYPPLHSPLYNGEWGDGHFSPFGSRVWASAVGERAALVLQNRAKGDGRTESGEK